MTFFIPKNTPQYWDQDNSGELIPVVLLKDYQDLMRHLYTAHKELAALQADNQLLKSLVNQPSPASPEELAWVRRQMQAEANQKAAEEQRAAETHVPGLRDDWTEHTESLVLTSNPPQYLKTYVIIHANGQRQVVTSDSRCRSHREALVSLAQRLRIELAKDSVVTGISTAIQPHQDKH